MGFDRGRLPELQFSKLSVSERFRNLFMDKPYHGGYSNFSADEYVNPVGGTSAPRTSEFGGTKPAVSSD